MRVWMLALMLGCGPKQAPAAPGHVAMHAEAAALRDLADELETRAATAPDPDGYRDAARLADALAAGTADPDVRESAVDLLDWLLTWEPEPLDPEVVETPVLVVVEPGDPPVDPAGEAADERALAAIADERIRRARDHLRRADYASALDELEVLRDGPGWDEALPFWEEAVDGWVHLERERAGELFMASRRLPRSERIELLEEVRDLLEGLLEDYPDSAYTDPLQENLERVEKELEAMSLE